MFKGAQNQCGSADFLAWGPGIWQRVPAEWERICQAQMRWSKVVAPVPITAPPLQAAVTAQQLWQESQLAATAVHSSLPSVKSPA